MNPNLPIVTSQTFEDYAALGLVPQQVATSLSGALGIVGLLLAAIGMAIGLVLAAGTSQLLGALLFGVGAVDPIAFGGAALLFAIVGLLACYIPARRAQIDPMEALGYE